MRMKTCSTCFGLFVNLFRPRCSSFIFLMLHASFLCAIGHAVGANILHIRSCDFPFQLVLWLVIWDYAIIDAKRTKAVNLTTVLKLMLSYYSVTYRFLFQCVIWYVHYFTMFRMSKLGERQFENCGGSLYQMNRVLEKSASNQDKFSCPSSANQKAAGWR